MLAFYVVSQKKIEGGRFIDTKEFPKLGHIAAKPELQLASLKKAKLIRQPSGESAIQITLEANQADRFAEFAGKNVGRIILLMLNNKPLMAPKLLEKIRTESLQISIPDKLKRKQTLVALKKLVPTKD